jgi:hypothetical protein
MTPAIAATQEVSVKRGEKRSPSVHAASAITMKNNAGTMKTMAARLSPPCCRGRTKKPGAVSRPGVMRIFG